GVRALGIRIDLHLWLPPLGEICFEVPEQNIRLLERGRDLGKQRFGLVSIGTDIAHAVEQDRVVAHDYLGAKPMALTTSLIFCVSASSIEPNCSGVLATTSCPVLNNRAFTSLLLSVLTISRLSR